MRSRLRRARSLLRARSDLLRAGPDLLRPVRPVLQAQALRPVRSPQGQALLQARLLPRSGSLLRLS